MSANRVPSDDKLKDLECLFTWGINKDDINDLQGIPEKLLDRVKYCPRRYHATYYNILAFVSHLEKNTDVALEYLAKAEAVLKEEKRDEADFLVTYSSFAWLYHHLGNLEDMETYLGKVRSIGEGRDIAVEAEKGWSFIRFGAKFYPKATECFVKTLDANPDSAYYNVGYAMALYRLEELDREKVKISPPKITATEQLQKVYLAKKTDSDSDALELDSIFGEVMVLLALKLQSQDHFKSRELISEALEKFPDTPHVIRYTGTYFRREGSTIEALQILKAALERAPNSSFLYHHMGVCHWKDMVEMKKDKKMPAHSPEVKAATQRSIECFKKAVELKPSNTYAYVHLAQAYGESQQLEDAEGIYNELISNKSLSITEKQHCHVKYGLFLMHQRKDYTKATLQLKEAYKIKINSNDRREAREKLKLIAVNKQSWRSRGDDDILAFLSEQDQQDRQLARAAAAEESVDELNEFFKRRLAM